MKKIYLLWAAMLLCGQSAFALIVNVNGYGEVPANGLVLTISEAEQDPLSGKPLMSLQGDILSNGTLNVSITRSAADLEDEFCCAGQCTSGNKTKKETLEFNTSGVASWYTHYAPAEQSFETVIYLFSDSEGSRKVTVHYTYGTTVPTAFAKKHLIEEFTGQGCGYCPYGMDAVSDFMKNDPNWVLILHHTYGTDNFSVTGSKTIASQLGVQSAPQADIDRVKTNYVAGNAIIFHPGYMPYVNKNQFAKETYASVNIKNSFDASTRKLNVTVSGYVCDPSKTNLKLTVLVKESGMIAYQADFYETFEGWQEFRHANAVRAFLTAATGTAISLDETQRYEKTLSTTLNANWVPENCMVVAFLSEAFKPVVQADELPVVEGTAGGADLEHERITATPVEDYYPEPGENIGPKYYSNLQTETMNVASGSYKAYTTDGYNVWSIQAYDNTRTVRVNNVSCVPFVWIYLFTELDQTLLPNGTYPFNTSMQPGTAYAGFRDDETKTIDGSEFYFTAASYFNQGYLSPYAEWLISSGTLIITDTGWSVTATARNGQPINILGTTPIDYPGRPEGVENISGDGQKTVKFMEEGRLYLRTSDGARFDGTGARIQ